MQEVELLDGDDDVTVQPAPPARDRRRLWWVPAGAAAVALSLVGTQLVVDAREDAAVARLAAVPGVFPPLGDELEVLRTISQRGRHQHLGRHRDRRRDGRPASWSRTDGSQSFTAVDQRTGETLWSTPLLGPDADRAASLENGYGGGCQGDGSAASRRRSPPAWSPTGSCATRTTGRRSGYPRPPPGWWSSTRATGT